MNKKLTDEQLVYAKQQYMNYRSVSDIAREMGINRGTLQHWVNEYWKGERVLRRNELAAEFSEAKGAIMTSTFSCSFKGVQAWVQRVTDPNYDMKPHEVKTLMSVITEMDKIMRLDQGSPTDIIADTKPVTVHEIRKQIVASDPFLIEDTDFKELDNEKIEDPSESVN